MSSADNSLKRPQSIPPNPGVYTFLDGREKPVYIGKAANLKKRLNSYWRKNVSAKVGQLLGEAVKVRWVMAESEIDALLKEAELIKQYRPKYNILMRDDKNYFYVGFTKETFPRIFMTHQPRGPQTKFIGPFTSGGALKIVLQLLRRLFPYCTCGKPHKRPCLNSQIGRCPGYCCVFGTMDKKSKAEYMDNIKDIRNILTGKKKSLFKKLKKEMRQAAKLREFERAAVLRDQMLGIENIFSHPLTPVLRVPRSPWPKIEKVIQTVTRAKKRISRVEGYDISNISGTAATGSMVVFVEGIPAKSEYRKFKIKTVHQISDVDMLKEVIGRRLAHKEWQYPDLMLIDGGKPQLNAVRSVITSNQLSVIKLASLAKREEELYIEGQAKPILLSTLPPNVAFFFQRVRDESHRFAKRYHHKLREKQI